MLAKTENLVLDKKRKCKKNMGISVCSMLTIHSSRVYYPFISNKQPEPWIQQVI